jgi:hypothetical protein
LLIDKGADINAVSNNAFLYPLQVLSRWVGLMQPSPVTRMLIAEGRRHSFTSRRQRQIELAKLLLEHGANLNAGMITAKHR